MSLLNIFDISGSALSAQSQRMNVSASNMANADSVTGPDGEPYRAKQVVFQSRRRPGSRPAACALPGGGRSGARASGVPAGQPAGGRQGLRAHAERRRSGGNGQYHLRFPQLPANVEVLNTTKSMMMKTLTLGQ